MFDKRACALRYYYENKERCRENNKRWVKENFESRQKYLKGYHKKWYAENRGKRLRESVLYYKTHKSECDARSRKTEMNRIEFINRKKMSPCMDCKIQYGPWVMEFDHRDPSQKKFSICDGRNSGMAGLIEEMNKCDVVCRNCHAERTHRRRLVRV
jgi:hypothetical protein